jgi:hypothetical protein
VRHPPVIAFIEPKNANTVVCFGDFCRYRVNIATFLALPFDRYAQHFEVRSTQ